jgi:DNA-binding NarL/FixJ family response regulator
VSITVAVVDDQELVRSGLVRILGAEADLVVVGDAADGRCGVELVRAHRPDVVLMDIRMPVLDGLGATREIRSIAPVTAVIVLTTFDLDEYVYDALEAGAAGFLLKDAPADDLVRAVRVAARGDAMIDPSVTRRLLSTFAEQRRRPDARLALLTQRERDVLMAMARGLSNAEICAELYISDGTVRTHVTRILSKLGVRDRLQAVVLANECGAVVRPPGR